MKKIVFALFVALALSSCSKDSNEIEAVGDNVPKVGRYLYSDNSITAEISIDDKVSIAIYQQNGLSLYQSTPGIILGDWPVYEYRFSGLALLCTYSNSKEFNANVENGTGISLPKTMRFTYRR